MKKKLKKYFEKRLKNNFKKILKIKFAKKKNKKSSARFLIEIPIYSEEKNKKMLKKIEIKKIK